MFYRLGQKAINNLITRYALDGVLFSKFDIIPPPPPPKNVNFVDSALLAGLVRSKPSSHTQRSAQCGCVASFLFSFNQTGAASACTVYIWKLGNHYVHGTVQARFPFLYEYTANRATSLNLIAVIRKDLTDVGRSFFNF
jgi:hypothetical protein